MTCYKRDRSSFFLAIQSFDNGSCYITINRMIKECFIFHFPELEDTSTNRWKSKHNNCCSIWIPSDRAGDSFKDKICFWAQQANQFLWLSPNSSPIRSHFNGADIPYCFAGDFNLQLDGTAQRTVLGEAEYRVKYGDISDEKRSYYLSLLMQSIKQMACFLPIPKRPLYRFPSLFFSSIPLAQDRCDSFVHQLITFAGSQFTSAQIITPTLRVQKPEMKNLSLNDKIQAWQSIYSDSANINIDLSSINGATIVIVDDLYQSGTTMLAYASFLKNHGAGSIYGLSCVKSMKNSDNTNNSRQI